MKILNWFQKPPEKLEVKLTTNDVLVYTKVTWPLVNQENEKEVIDTAYDLYKIIVTCINIDFFQAIKVSVAGYAKVNKQEKVAVSLILALDKYLEQYNSAAPTATTPNRIMKPSQAFKVNHGA